MLDLRQHFSRFLNTEPDRLHFAAHSHHPWPDVTRDAQAQAWEVSSAGRTKEASIRIFTSLPTLYVC